MVARKRGQADASLQPVPGFGRFWSFWVTIVKCAQWNPKPVLGANGGRDGSKNFTDRRRRKTHREAGGGEAVEFHPRTFDFDGVFFGDEHRFRVSGPGLDT